MKFFLISPKKYNNTLCDPLNIKNKIVKNSFQKSTLSPLKVGEYYD